MWVSTACGGAAESADAQGCPINIALTNEIAMTANHRPMVVSLGIAPYNCGLSRRLKDAISYRV